MSDSNNADGIGVLGLLGVAFVVLKLTGHIDWSWWWVTAPFWGVPALVAGVLLMLWIVVLCTACIERIAK